MRLFSVEVVFNGVSCVCDPADRAVEYVKVQQRSPTANTPPPRMWSAADITLDNKEPS